MSGDGFCGIFPRSPELPAGFTGTLQADEGAITVGELAGGGHLVLTRLGLWVPEGAEFRRIGWHLVSKAVWDTSALVVTEAVTTGTVDDAVLLADLPPRRFRACSARHGARGGAPAGDQLDPIQPALRATRRWGLDRGAPGSRSGRRGVAGACRSGYRARPAGSDGPRGVSAAGTTGLSSVTDSEEVGGSGVGPGDLPCVRRSPRQALPRPAGPGGTPGDPTIVVDLGCGPGNLTRLLAKRWPMASITALDSSSEMVQAARERGIHAELCDVRRWSPVPGTGLVVCNAVLQWVPEHAELLRQWMRELPAGGWLALQVPGELQCTLPRRDSAAGR